MPILTADFYLGSTKDYLDKLGFMNVFAMNFASSLIDSEGEIKLSVLKSGDFRVLEMIQYYLSSMESLRVC